MLQNIILVVFFSPFKKVYSWLTEHTETAGGPIQLMTTVCLPCSRGRERRWGSLILESHLSSCGIVGQPLALWLCSGPRRDTCGAWTKTALRPGLRVRSAYAHVPSQSCSPRPTLTLQPLISKCSDRWTAIYFRNWSAMYIQCVPSMQSQILIWRPPFPSGSLGSL